MSGPQFPSPLVLQRADPSVIRHDGEYYFTASYPAFDRIVLRRSANLEDLEQADEVTIWTKDDEGPCSQLIWAPELHRVGGAWYVYFAAAPSVMPSSDGPGAAATFNHRVYVLECTDADPLAGTWVERGQVDTGWESFALDATTVVHRGIQYLIWAQQDVEIAGNSNLYIARMANPWTLASDAVPITRPEYEWEMRVHAVNEGPSVLASGERLYITYSASGTGIEYAMGVLVADADADLLDPASWQKSALPVMSSNPDDGIYGPGHNSFTQLADGTPVLVYHARTYTEIVGDPLWDPNRHAFAVPLEIDADGAPVWPVPGPVTRAVPAAGETVVL